MTREHRFQAMKGTNQKDHDYVAGSSGPGEAKRRGRAIWLRPDWGNDINQVCWYVMMEGVLATVMQHDDVAQGLEDTGERVIYEDSPTDDIWGWRKDGNHEGRNLLGLAWMQARLVVMAKA